MRYPIANCPQPLRLRFLIFILFATLFIPGNSRAESVSAIRHVPPGGGILWKIAKGCVQSYREGKGPGKCAQVSIASGTKRGSILLKDLRGATQFLLIPTTRVTGIEDPKLLQQNAPNFWRQAWEGRWVLSKWAGKKVPRDSIGFAINAIEARSQNQLHIHMDCVSPVVLKALKRVKSRISDRWGSVRISIPGAGTHQVLFLRSKDLSGFHPFRMLASDIRHGKHPHMGDHDLVIIGAHGADGQPGFYLLDGFSDGSRMNTGSGERALVSCKDGKPNI